MRTPWLCAAALAMALPALALEPADVERAATHEATRGLRAITKRLAGPGYMGRDNDTPESSKAQRYLIRKLQRLGDGIHGGRSFDAYRQPFVRSGNMGTNLVAVIPGRELPDEVVLVGGHYDHLGTRSDANGDCRSRGVPGGVRCPGAADNAAGTAIVLAIGKAIRSLPEPPRRTVALVLWDSEEDGLVGSRWWVSDEPLIPLARTVAYVNFDLQGSNLLPSLSRISFAVGAETGGSALAAFVAGAVAQEDIDTVPVSYLFGELRSDYANLVQYGRVPTVFFGDSSGPCYHHVGDTIENVDFAKLRLQSRVGFRTVMALAEADERPPFVDPNTIAPVTYADAVSIERVFRRADPDIPVYFEPMDQMLLRQIQADLAAVVGAGPGAFDATAIGITANAALQGIAAIGRVPCGAF